MKIFIGSAKIMTGQAPAGFDMKCTEPRFQHQADALAEMLASYTPEELGDMLRCNPQLAKENWLRYQHFFDPAGRLPAAFAYDGTVYQKLAPETWSHEDMAYAQEHLIMGSFLYGLLRPLDLVHPYRLEGNVVLPGNDHQNMFQYWRPILTDAFIESVKADDGVLVNLASNEFRDIFDWKRVAKELKIITPDFKVDKDGKPRTVVVYAKMCRGAMSRWIIQNRIDSPDDLPDFEFEGFTFRTPWHYVL